MSLCGQKNAVDRKGREKRTVRMCFFLRQRRYTMSVFTTPLSPPSLDRIEYLRLEKKRNRYLPKKLPPKGPNNGNEQAILDPYNSIRGFNYPYYSPSLFLHLSRSANHPPRLQQQGKRRSQTVVKRAPFPPSLLQQQFNRVSVMALSASWIIAVFPPPSPAPRQRRRGRREGEEDFR